MRRFIPQSVFFLYHWALALLGAFWHMFPSRHIIVIGVTGTNGKSTVVDLTHKIFEHAGFRVASASSIRFIINDREWKNELKMTMPGRFFLQRFIWEAVQKKCDVVILEVTSEGLRQYRHSFIHFDTAALTNITPEHIESHGGFDKYRSAKLKLFRAISSSSKRSKSIIINGDDPSAELFLQYHRSEAWIYGFKRDHWEKFGKKVEPQSYKVGDTEISFVYKNIDFHLKLLGEFNLYNALCAMTIALSRGIEPKIIREAFESVSSIPGRLEYVTRPPRTAFSVVVDYAHTPDALFNVYKTLKDKRRKLICVLGSAGGGRDRWKRSEMGKLADQWCDNIILTNEDPYDEDPELIIKDIEKGIEQKRATVIIDREEAIRAGVAMAGPDDTVVITGKGSEPWMMISGGRKLAWDDRNVVQKILGGSGI